MNYCNIVTQEGPVENLPSRLSAHGLDIHGPDFAMCAMVGWRLLDALPSIPDGQQLASKTFAQDSTRPDYALATYGYEAIPLPIPTRFADGIDANLLVLDTATGKGVGYVATDEGDIVPVLFAHESPYDMAGLKLKIDAARIAYKAAKDAAKVVMDALKADVAQLKADKIKLEADLALVKADVEKLKKP